MWRRCVAGRDHIPAQRPVCGQEVGNGQTDRRRYWFCVMTQILHSQTFAKTQHMVDELNGETPNAVKVRTDVIQTPIDIQINTWASMNKQNL